jgi:hypothetical protein
MAVTTTSLAVKDGNNASQSLTTLTDPAGLERYSVSLDTPGVAAFRVAVASAAVITTASKTIVNIQGSATKTVRIKKIGFSLTAATAAQGVLLLARTTGVGSGGTAVTPAIAKMDSGTVAAATAVVTHYTTGAQSQGAGGTQLAVTQVNESVTTTAPTFLGAQNFQFLFPESGVCAGNALVLRGTSDYLEIWTATAIGTTPALSYMIEWEEDAS